MTDLNNPPAADNALHEWAKRMAAEELGQAEDAILKALAEYRHVLAKGPVLDSTEIIYRPSKAGIDDHKFRIDLVNAAAPYVHDGPFLNACDAELPAVQVALLSFSPHWEDRIRAAALRGSIRDEVTMPDGFPCIYEPADSPSRSNTLYPRSSVWVASPDEGMLHELLPLYRELWGAYEDQWPHSPNRTFQVGRLDGVSPRGVYRPGTTPAEVIGQTMLTHPDMRRTAPEHLRQMHPL